MVKWVGVIGDGPTDADHEGGWRTRSPLDGTDEVAWVVRYAIDGRHRSKSFRTRVEAERYRGSLWQAGQAGDRFDVASGEPESWQPALRDLGVHDWARRWLSDQWSEWQPRTQASATEALARIVTSAVDPAKAAGWSARLPIQRAISGF